MKRINFYKMSGSGNVFIILDNRDDVVEEKNLTKFIRDEDSLKRIGKIYLKILENATPIYRQEDIILIVEATYDSGNKETADDICNTYGRRGVHFLQPVWKKNNIIV